MKKGMLLFVLICGLSIISNAQKNKDFILTLNKDTIFGKIKIVLEHGHIVFTHQRKRVYFHPKTLPAFGIYSKSGNYQIYKSITNVRGTSMFVEVLDEGMVKLYKYYKNEPKDNPNNKKDLYLIGKSDKRLATITPESYERTMRVLVKDHPNLLAKVDNISYKEVPQIVASYNQLR